MNKDSLDMASIRRRFSRISYNIINNGMEYEKKNNELCEILERE